MNVDGAGTSSAMRRRQRRLRAMPRHGRQTVAMELAAALHHSRCAGPWTYAGLRAQKTASPGERPGVLTEPEPQGRAVTVGYVAAPVQLLAVPLLAGAAGEAVDDAALSFLLKQSLAEKEEGEERRQKVKEAVARLRAKVHASEPLTAAEHAAWYGSSSFFAGKRRKRRKRKKRKRRLPRTSSRPSRQLLRRLLRFRVRVCRLLERLLLWYHAFGGVWVFWCRSSYPLCVGHWLLQHSANSVLDCAFSLGLWGEGVHLVGHV